MPKFTFPPVCPGIGTLMMMNLPTLMMMNLPTNDRDWLPLAANPREWWKLINKKPHQVLSGPAAPATKHGL